MQTGTLQNLITYVINFINHFLVPFVFAIAFAMFLFGVFRFFFVQGTDPKARNEGRGFIIGAIIAFAVMVSVWGLVNLVRGTIPLGSTNQPPLPTFDGSGGNTGGTAPGVVPAPSNTAPGTVPAPSSGTGVVPSQSGPTTGACANGACSDVQGLY